MSAQFDELAERGRQLIADLHAAVADLPPGVNATWYDKKVDMFHFVGDAILQRAEGDGLVSEGTAALFSGGEPK